jgi:hypothetical protein
MYPPVFEAKLNDMFLSVVIHLIRPCASTQYVVIITAYFPLLQDILVFPELLIPEIGDAELKFLITELNVLVKMSSQ